LTPHCKFAMNVCGPCSSLDTKLRNPSNSVPQVPHTMPRSTVHNTKGHRREIKHTNVTGHSHIVV